MANNYSTDQSFNLQLYKPLAMVLCALITLLGTTFAILSFATGNVAEGIAGSASAISSLVLIVLAARDATHRIANPPKLSAESMPLIEPVTSAQNAYAFLPGQYIYIIQDEDVTHLCKIGKTSDPARRLTNHGVLLPFSVRIICVLPVKNTAKSEAALHRVFASKRVRGEWFALDASDVAKIVEVLR